MKATFEIDEALLDNGAEFDNAFFRRFNLRHAPKPLQLNETISKNYSFPTLYGDVTCAIAIYLCPYEKAAALMPHPIMKPVKVTRGRAPVVFSCYEYKRVLGVAPYNEIAMTLPVMVNPKLNVPILPLVTNLFPCFGYYVFSMPVTSLENQIRGLKLWGLPKVVQEIDIVEEGGDCVTTAREASGEPYFELRVPMEGTPTDFDVSSNLYSRLGDSLLQSRTCFQGRFNVTKYMGQMFKKNAPLDRPYLKLGDTPSGRVLKELELEEHPFQFRFAKSISSCFDLPNPEYRSPINFA
jgi:hypothetical protein